MNFIWKSCGSISYQRWSQFIKQEKHRQLPERVEAILLFLAPLLQIRGSERHLNAPMSLVRTPKSWIPVPMAGFRSALRYFWSILLSAHFFFNSRVSRSKKWLEVASGSKNFAFFSLLLKFLGFRKQKITCSDLSQQQWVAKWVNFTFFKILAPLSPLLGVPRVFRIPPEIFFIQKCRNIFPNLPFQTKSRLIWGLFTEHVKPTTQLVFLTEFFLKKKQHEKNAKFKSTWGHM